MDKKKGMEVFMKSFSILMKFMQRKKKQEYQRKTDVLKDLQR